jgi:hypothetical protein
MNAAIRILPHVLTQVTPLGVQITTKIIFMKLTPVAKVIKNVMATCYDFS